MGKDLSQQNRGLLLKAPPDPQNQCSAAFGTNAWGCDHDISLRHNQGVQAGSPQQRRSIHQTVWDHSSGGQLPYSEYRSSCAGQLGETKEYLSHWCQLTKKVLPFSQVFIVQSQILLCRYICACQYQCHHFTGGIPSRDPGC